LPDIDHGPITLEDLDGRAFCDVWEAATILNRDPRTIRQAIKAGEIPAVRLGLRYSVPVAWLNRAASSEAADPARAVS
jgi:excisionase family DNA binding protein